MQAQKKMEKYYFKTTGWNNAICTEKCKVKKNGVMIGSLACQRCEFCAGPPNIFHYAGDMEWIECKKLEQAL